MRNLILPVILSGCTDTSADIKIRNRANYGETSRTSSEFFCSNSPSMDCSLDETIVLNSEGSSVEVSCYPEPLSCISSVEYKANELGTGVLTRIPISNVYRGTIDTEGASVGRHKIRVNGIGEKNVASKTLFLRVLDHYVTDLPPVVDSFGTTEYLVPRGTDVTLESFITDDDLVVLAYTELGGDINIMTESDSDLFTAIYSTDDLPFGENTATLTAYDSAGQTTEATTSFIVYDGIPPSISSVTVDPQTIYNAEEDRFIVSATITDDVGIESATVTIDTLEEALTDDDGDGVYESRTFTGSEFALGTYAVTITASDTFNTVEDTSLEVTVGDLLESYVACYDFENNLDDATGVYNASGSPTYTTGVVGYAANLTGVSDIINTGLDIDPTNGFAIAGWIYVDVGACRSSCSAWNVWHDEGTHELTLFLGGSYYGGKLRYLIEPNGGGADEQLDSITDTVDLEGAWHHIATTFSNENDTQIIYIDGVSDNSRTITVDNHNATKQIWLGAFDHEWFNGKFDSLAIYERNVSADSIAALYNSGNGLSCF